MMAKENKMIHEAIYQALIERPERAIDNKLWVSDLGKNPYFALKRIVTGEMEPFDYQTLMKMDNGNAFEANSLRQIAENLPNRIITQMPLFDDIWGGYADLVINPFTEDAIIYDHKGSAGKWWDYKESLPRASDCCQVYMYGKLYEKKYGVFPRLGLYYRGWGSWAEFEIMTTNEMGASLIPVPNAYIRATGKITDEKGNNTYEVERVRMVDPELLIAEMEEYYALISVESITTTLEKIEEMNPGGPEWDYAESATLRLR